MIKQALAGGVACAEWNEAVIADDRTGEDVIVVFVRPLPGGLLSDDGEPITVEFQLAKAQEHDEDEVMVEGTIKWDGCVDWHTPKNYTAHACDPREFEHLAMGFQVAMQMAIRAMPNGAKRGSLVQRAPLRELRGAALDYEVTPATVAHSP